MKKIVIGLIVAAIALLVGIRSEGNAIIIYSSMEQFSWRRITEAIE